ncbi:MULTISPECIES: hypothetical protein [unclassified Bradyrhizobium]|nr:MULTISPECIES: hypothetical protein [unclassified Bradyrhizobium]
MLASIDLDHEPPFETDEIQNILLERAARDESRRTYGEIVRQLVERP